jgi:hypothetical protein
MNVIGGTVDDYRRSLHHADDSSEIGKQVTAKRHRFDQRASA